MIFQDGDNMATHFYTGRRRPQGMSPVIYLNDEKRTLHGSFNNQKGIESEN